MSFGYLFPAKAAIVLPAKGEFLIRYMLISAVSAAAMLSACQSEKADFSATDREAIEAASAEWVDTYNRNDWDALAALFAPEAVMMPPFGPAVIGREAIADWEDANESGFRIALFIDEISGSGDLAYVRGRSCVFIPLGEGVVGVDPGKYLEIRKRHAGGAWLIETDIFNSDSAMGADLLDACPFE